VENGPPGTEWRIKDDPRHLLAVVHKLKEYQAQDTHYVKKRFPPDKFVARMGETGYVEIEVPYMNGDRNAFLFVLTQTLESMAKIKIEMEWGRKFLGAMVTRSGLWRPPEGRLAL